MIHEETKSQVSSRGLLLGTCTGIADHTGLATGIVRIGAVIAMCIWFKLTLLTYCGLAIYYRFRR